VVHKLVDELGFKPDVYHLNEAHAISAAFYLLNKNGGNLAELKKQLVFTTHTPEEAGNEKHDIYLCNKMSYFCGMPLEKVREITGLEDDQFNHSLVALRFARLSNAVSELHESCEQKNVEQARRGLPDHPHHQFSKLALLGRQAIVFFHG